MDLLEQPDVKKTYEKCKYIVKVWEHSFKKQHRRLPSKFDIKEASTEVRYAYRKYFQLKTAALEQSFRDVDGFEDEENEDTSTSQDVLNEIDSNIADEAIPITSIENISTQDEVWGPHLNNKKQIVAKAEETNKSNVKLNITKKLFCGSKFTKRNPRKSLSFSQKTRSDVSVDMQISASQPASTSESYSFNSEEIILNQAESIFSSDKYKIVTPTVRTSQPINIIQSVLNNYQPTLKTVDVGWLERVVQNAGNTIVNPDLSLPSSVSVDSEPTKLDYDSDDIIADSEDDDDTKEINIFHIAKKKRVDSTDIPKPVTLENTCSNDEERNETALVGIENATVRVENSTKTDVNEQIENVTDTKQKRTRAGKKKGRTKTQSKKRKAEVGNANAELISPRRSERTTKVKSSLEEFTYDIEEEDEQDAFHTDTDEKDPEFTLDMKPKSKPYVYGLSESESEGSVSNKTKSGSTPKPKPNKKVKKLDAQSEDDELEENKPYELEFSVKPRVVAPRYRNIKKVLMENKIVVKTNNRTLAETNKNNVIKNKTQQAKENMEKKIATGNLNDNFVRINLKKKVFARGKTGKSYSKYKKAMWKSKQAKALAGPDMDMGGCDGGMLTCFNCGQIGHFARNCQAEKGDGLLPLAPDQEDECPYPTLEEASQMARESVLSVRLPKIDLNRKDDSNIEAVGQIREQTDEVEGDNEFDDDLSDQLLAETLKLEEHIKKLDVQLYMDTVKAVQPYYALNEDGSTIPPPLEIYETLQKFGHSLFRSGQEQAIMRILSGKSTLVTLSTGSGKSLCYQLPAYLYSQREPCISLVVSPLVSLMDDQVVGMPKFMKAACLHSNQTKAQRQKILEAISLGELSILLISPEAVVAGEKQAGFGSLLRKLPPIAFACIDEAHCVSQWSHNFRPSYLMICRVLRESLGVKTILGLTATATRATRDSIINHLQIPDGHDGIISDVPLPDNLVLTVSRDQMRDHALLGLLTSERFTDCKSIIVYCTRRDECERIASFLRTSLKSEQVVDDTLKKRKRVNLQAEPYHAGLSASRRRTIQNKFMSGELRIVVATVAFGMGINKSDIRAVIHFNMPNSFESYVQEVGRAGRDGLTAQCHVFLDLHGRDENELQRHIHANSIERHVIRKLLQKIFIPCSCSGQCPKHEVAFSIEGTVRSLDIPEENIATLLCYLELHSNKYVQLLNPAYTMCKVISYGGHLQIRKAAKDCPPLAMALALHKSNAGDDPNVLEFPVVDVAAAMGWESGICKHKLKSLEWITVNNQPKRSTISVQFSDLGFRLFAPGNLIDDELDEALDNLYTRVTEQEKKALTQLHAIHKTLKEVAQPTYRTCVSESSDRLIKSKVREYFNSPDPLQFVSIVKTRKFNEEQLVSDIHALICMYRDNTFTGRSVARIFQGIQSPNYPAVIWGRCKFWRSHLDVSFHDIVKIATREILRMR